MGGRTIAGALAAVNRLVGWGPREARHGPLAALPLVGRKLRMLPHTESQCLSNPTCLSSRFAYLRGRSDQHKPLQDFALRKHALAASQVDVVWWALCQERTVSATTISFVSMASGVA